MKKMCEQSNWRHMLTQLPVRFFSFFGNKDGAAWVIQAV